MNNNNKIINSHKQQIFDATVCWLTSDFKTRHIMCKPTSPFTRLDGAFQNLEGLTAGGYSPSLLPLPPPPLFPLLFSVQLLCGGI